MGLSLCVLGSGSRGNCAVVRATGSGDAITLIDCGLSPRVTAERLAEIGAGIDGIRAIVLTHLDRDHYAPGWSKVIRERGIPTYLYKTHRNRAARLGVDGRRIEMFDGPFSTADGLDVEPVPLAHDTLGTVGFVIERAGARLGYATDLGRVPRTLLDRFVGLHALAIESNYDRTLQVASPRPQMLKRRIMGGRGHLSNEDTLKAVAHIATRSDLAHVVLLHLSEECNAPSLVQRLYRERLPHLAERVVLTSQTRPTDVLDVRAGQPRADQLALFPG